MKTRQDFELGLEAPTISSEAFGKQVFYSVLSNPASAMPVSPTLNVYAWSPERWSDGRIVSW
jgi:hypothetical protein